MRTSREMRRALIEKAGEDEEFRSRLISDPRAAIESEFEIELPDSFDIKVHEDSASMANFVLPPNPALTTQELEAASGAGYYNDEDSDLAD